MKKIETIETKIDIIEVLENCDFQLKDLTYFTLDEKGNLKCEVLDRLVLDEIVRYLTVLLIEKEELKVEYTGSYTKRIEDGIIFVKAEVIKKG